MTRVLVTGARGFVGRHLTPLLVAGGWDVHAVTSATPGASDDVTWHRADLLDANQRERLIETTGATALVHLAWCAKPPGYWTDPANLQWLAATVELARHFQTTGGLRSIIAGTCAEYEWSAQACAERSTPLKGQTLYGTAKAACGTVLDAFGAKTGLSVAWARLFFLFGPHDHAMRLVPSLVRDLSAGRPATCRAGNHARDFLHVNAAARALMALLESDVTGPVNIGSGVAVRVEQVARRIAHVLDAGALLSIEPGPPRDALVLADTTRLREEVGWQPPTDIMADLDATIRWWQSAPDTGTD
jgi:nucleoside-diphosphate-sugar epimerase